ncbi:hypothetical protein OTU49_015019 [Cherax quadricarinatus]|uniref:Uncharacterized protein n=1 Tax=Cherax quadricarinatus TaxID=27406 RepID=A0AAW0Y482_CHEQU
MTPAGNFQPEIKFRWCRTVGCRSQQVWLVLTSVTGTRVCLTWQPQLGWYEASPTPIPCGLHTGFILIQDKVRDAISGSLRVRERDYKVDPFHIVPHKFAVELFLQSDQTSPFWSDVPELRRRYLSSDHLERLATSSHKDSLSYHQFRGLGGRKWVSSTSLTYTEEVTSSNIPKNLARGDGRSRAHPRGLTRGRSHSQLRASSTSFDNLKDQGATSISSPNLSRAFQVAVDLSRASSKFLAGLSSTSSGVCLGFEDGSEPPSPDNKDTPNNNSPYAAGGETSADSEDAAGEGARRKKALYSSRDRSLHIEDLTGEEAWGQRREGVAKSFDGSNASSTSYEDLLANISSRRATFKTELNLLRFDTLAQERLVKEILAPSDSDFEDEEGACEVSDSDFAGHYGCVITFESRSSSMDDVGSPRALEDVLVSLTSNDSHPEVTFEPSQSRTHSSDMENDSEFNLGTPSSSERRQSEPKPGTAVTRSCLVPSSFENKILMPAPPIVNITPVSDTLLSDEPRDARLSTSQDSSPGHDDSFEGEDHQAMSEEEVNENEVGPGTSHLGENVTSTSGTSDPPVTPDIAEDDNFQYESLKHEDEHFPIDIRNIDSEDSMEGVVSKTHVRYDVEEKEACSRSEGDDDDRESGLYEITEPQPTTSLDGEVPTDSLSLVPLEDSQKATVREAKEFSEAQTFKKVSSDEGDVPKSSEEPTVQLHESESTSGVMKPREINSNENAEATCSTASVPGKTLENSGTGITYEVGERIRTLDDDGDHGRIFDNGTYEKGNDKAYDSESYESGDKGRTLESTTHNDNRGKNLDIRNIEGDRNRKSYDKTYRSDDRGRTLNVRTYENGDRGRTYKDGDRSSVLMRDEKGVSFDVDQKRTFPCTGGRTLTGSGDVGKPDVSGSLSSKKYRDYDRERNLKATAGGNTGKQDPSTAETSSHHLQERDAENHELHQFDQFVRLQDAGTQTRQTRRASKMTSTRMHKFNKSEDITTPSATKYSRSPLRSVQTESYVALPDRLSGPWSQRLARGSNAPPVSPGKPDLAALQRNLYNLVQGHENAVYLRQLQNGLQQQTHYAPRLAHLSSASDPSHHHQSVGKHHHSQHQSPIKHLHSPVHRHHEPPVHHHHESPALHHHQSPVKHHQSPTHHHHQSLPMKHHHYQSPIHHYHHSPNHQQPLPSVPQTSTPIQYKYPVMNSSIVQSSSSLAYFATRSSTTSRDLLGNRSSGVNYGGSASDLSRHHHASTFINHGVVDQASAVSPAFQTCNIQPSTTLVLLTPHDSLKPTLGPHMPTLPLM